MKKVLKLIVMIAVISALTAVAFAAGSPVAEPVENNSGASEIVSAVADLPEGFSIELAAPTEEAANLAAAQADHPDGFALPSFDVNLKDAAGNAVHEGATLTLTITVPAEYVGGTLYLYEDGALAQTIAITGTTVTIVIDSFSTYTPVLVKAAAVTPAPGPVTPQTMQTLLPYALGILAVAAVAVAVVAKKHSFN